MALRDHSLDERITSAAMEEFSEKGYSGASLRRIAEKAGVTVGAIQTRYKSKDELFSSLLSPFLNDIAALFQSIKSDYNSGADCGPLAQLKSSMQHESSAILHLIFEHYEQAVLLIRRSAGSSLEHYFDEIVKSKVAESISFFRSHANIAIDEGLLGLLISAQFDSYRRIIECCCDRRSAEEYMNALMVYHLGGWVALFDSGDHS